ncbi:hypothetical protein [Micromonospora sp. U21]|nr:hypothetical protein [Micromonospora sp. U21]MBQ0902874.1 hypothetical protein [Micromonospora sp. U21]
MRLSRALLTVPAAAALVLARDGTSSLATETPDPMRAHLLEPAVTGFRLE